MASAFQAGMIGGFADTFVQKIQDRTDKAEKYEDMMIASAKANAPKYAETTAAYKATVSQARQLKDSFGFTDSEIVAMASKYDLNAIHKTLMEQKMAAEANASELGFDKSTILGSLNMASSITMPKGMTLESGLRNILFNTTQNLNASNNPKSEVNKRGAFGKAMADFLALNPRASAEEQLKSMQYAGFSMDELRNFNASAGRGDIFPEVTAGPLALPDQDYKSSDFGSTQARTRQTFARNFKVLNEAGTDIDASLAKNVQSSSGVVDIFKDIETASEYMAFLESNIAFKGYGAGFGNELKRTGAMSRLIRALDTPEELKAFVAAERDGRFTKLIIETDGTFTDTQLEAVLNGEPIPGVEPAEETSVAAAGTDPVTGTSAAAAASGPAPLSSDATINKKVAELTGGTTDATKGISFGLSDEEERLRAEPIRTEEVIESPVLPPNVTDALISGQAFKEDVLDVAGNKIMPAPFKAVAAISDAVAYAADFVAGAMGAQESSPMSKRLRESAEQRRQTASEIAAKGWLSSMGISEPESVEAVAEGFRNTVFTEEGVKTANGLMSYEDFARERSKTQENVEPRFLRKGMQITLNPDFVEPDEPLSSIVTPPQSEEDKALEASMVAIDEERKRIQDMDRQFLADEKNYPQPLKAMTSIDPLSINTPAELDAAIAERVGEMPPDYKEQMAKAVEAINKTLKDFEAKFNLSVDTAIDTVRPSNLAEAISNLTARMFDETLEERIMKNEGQQNRAAAFAKLQEQLSELTLFPKRVSVDMKDIDPYPTMDAMASERLHSLQDDINESILSATKKFLSSIGIGSKKEEAPSKPEPLMAKPKRAEKPKEMTSSDKARLKRAQKARELGKDTGLLEMLVEKYGIALVQKEMGL